MSTSYKPTKKAALPQLVEPAVELFRVVDEPPCRTDDQLDGRLSPAAFQQVVESREGSLLGGIEATPEPVIEDRELRGDRTVVGVQRRAVADGREHLVALIRRQ